MKNGYRSVIDSFPISPLAKASIVRSTKVTLPALADAMVVMEKAYSPSNYPGFFLVLLGTYNLGKCRTLFSCAVLGLPFFSSFFVWP